MNASHAGQSPLKGGFAIATGGLVVAGGLLAWANSFISDQVKTQLSQQKIFFPPQGEATASPEIGPFINKYADKQLVSGQQAEAYANHFIAVHLKEVGAGLTFAELSSQALANPDDAELQGQVARMFKGETLRGLLLNAYAFDTMGRIAGMAAIAAFGCSGVTLLLSLPRFARLRRDSPEC